MLSFKTEHKKSYWKPSTSVLLSTSWILIKFSNLCAFLLLCGLVSIIFTIFSGVQKYVWRDLIHTVIKHFHFRTICKRTHCPSIGTLALLFFVSLQPKLSIPPCFRIQGGWSECDKVLMNEQTNGNPCF